VRISNQFDLEQALIFYDKQELKSIKLFVELDKEIGNFNQDLSKIEHIENINELNTEVEEKVEEKVEERAPESIPLLETEVKVEEIKQVEQDYALSKDEISVVLTEAVDKELEAMREKILAKLMKKTEKLLSKNGKKSCDKKEKKEPKEKKDKKEKKEVKESKEVVHFRVQCDGCGVAPITGTRYKCSVCDDFDYCENCETTYQDSHRHPFLKIRLPELAPVQIFCTINSEEVNDRQKYVTNERSYGHHGRRGHCGGPFRKIKNFFKDIIGGISGSFGQNQNEQSQEQKPNCMFQDFFSNFCGEKKPEVKIEAPIVDIKPEFISPKPEEVVSKPVVNDVIIEQVKPEVIYPKVEEILNVYPKVEEKPKVDLKEEKLIREIHISIMKELRQNYDLSLFSNAQILDAIEKSKGNPENVFLYLFA